MSLCILAGGKAVTLAVTAFTLAWTHSVEKTAWEEDWQVEASGLRLVSARVKGSGAGIDPPDGAVLSDGWWQWQPALPAQSRLSLAASGATVSGWSLCAQGKCLSLGTEAGEPVIVEPCEP
jgi:hypothetical protein